MALHGHCEHCDKATSLHELWNMWLRSYMLHNLLHFIPTRGMVTKVVSMIDLEETCSGTLSSGNPSLLHNTLLCTKSRPMLMPWNSLQIGGHVLAACSLLPIAAVRSKEVWGYLQCNCSQHNKAQQTMSTCLSACCAFGRIRLWRQSSAFGIPLAHMVQHLGPKFHVSSM